MIKAKVFKFAKQFDGFPKRTDMELVEEELPPIKDGEFLAEAVYLSVDPYMRAFSAQFPIGTTMVGYQVAKITESKNPYFPIGKYVFGSFGWRSHTISNGKMVPNSFLLGDPYLVEDSEDFPVSLSLGALGFSGDSAYYGFLDICTPKAGESVVVSAAAGSIGSLVGQIAKIKGCRVIGIAGSDEKGQWLLNDLKFDGFINYKTDDIDHSLSNLASGGVDCYFDNVGGYISSIVLDHMNDFGRISVCGMISKYNQNDRSGGYDIFKILVKQLKIEGFLSYKWRSRTDGTQQMINWMKEGKMKYRETKIKGFDKMFDAFVDVLNGGNYGKAIVEV